MRRKIRRKGRGRARAVWTEVNTLGERASRTSIRPRMVSPTPVITCAMNARKAQGNVSQQKPASIHK